jgi:hypothetical protein
MNMNGAIIERDLALIRLLTAKSALASFAIGKALSEIQMKRDQSVFWKDYVRGNLPFSVHTANAHIRLYEAYKDRPELLEGLGAAEALRRAKEARRE